MYTYNALTISEEFIPNILFHVFSNYNFRSNRGRSLQNESLRVLFPNTFRKPAKSIIIYMKRNYQKKSHFTADFILKWTILFTHLTQFIQLSFWLLINSKDLRASKWKDGTTKEHNIWNNWRTSTAYALNFVNWQIKL